MIRNTMLLCWFTLLVATGFGCSSPPAPTEAERSDRPDVDQPWTEQDQKAVDELAAEGERLAAARASEGVAPATKRQPQATFESASEHGLEIYVFNIGQADSMLIVGPAPTRKTLLVDLGKPTSGSKLPPNFDSSASHVYGRIQEITGRTDVDYFVASHYHSDHVGTGASAQQGWGTGVVGLLSDFSIDFSIGEFIHAGDEGAEFMAPEDERGIYKTVRSRMPLWQKFGRVRESADPRFGEDQIDLGPGVTVEILTFAGKVPTGDSAFEVAQKAGADYSAMPGNENDLSIALRISAGEFEMFTGGDLNGTDDEVEHPLYVVRSFGEIYTNIEHMLVNYLEKSSEEMDVEVYRVNHHGSGYSTTARLLEALDPEFVLYSTGADFDHPSNSVVARAGTTARQLATTWVNDLATFQGAKGKRVGEIEILVAQDGASYAINGEKHLAFSASQEASGDDEGEEDRQHGDE
jgi:beta-lactamase superfamily II metal-dependent hydrolase